MTASPAPSPAWHEHGTDDPPRLIDLTMTTGAAGELPADFGEACERTLAFLLPRSGFQQWFVARVRDGDWVVLTAAGEGPTGLVKGAQLRWDPPLDDWSSRLEASTDMTLLVERNGTVDEHQVRARSLVPISGPGDEPFGVLGGVSTAPADVAALDAELLDLLAGLLSRIVVGELAASASAARADEAAVLSLQDPLTRVGNRRAWERAIEAEEERCARYGHSAAVLMVDLDRLKEVNDTQGHGAGDELIRRTAEVLRLQARDVDVVCRLGGDEFAVLAVETDFEGARALAGRIDGAMADAGIEASVGFDVRHPMVGLVGAWYTADADMYRQKRPGR